MPGDDDPTTQVPDKPTTLSPSDVVTGHVVIAGIVGVFGNWMLIAFMHGIGSAGGGEVLLWGLAGILAGEAGVASLWLVFGPQRWWVRLAETTAIAFLVPAFVFMIVDSDPEVVRVFAVVPAAWAVFQIPMLVLRVVSRWRIVLGEEMVRQLEPTGDQFSLRDLFLVTTLVAVYLALVRVAFSDVPLSYLEFWFTIALAGLWNLVVAGTCLWAGLRSSAPASVAVVLVILVFVGSLLLLVPFGGGEGVVPITFFHAAAIATLSLVLRAARNAGYLLVRYNRRPDHCVAHVSEPEMAAEKTSP